MKRFLLFGIMVGAISQLIGGDTPLHTFLLKNGTKGYLHSNHSPSPTALRVIMRKPSCDCILYSYDSSSLQEINDFLKHCAQRATPDFQENTMKPELCVYPCSTLPLLPKEIVNEIAVIAVGNFLPDVMEKLIETQFSSLYLAYQEQDLKDQVSLDNALSRVALKIEFPLPRWGCDRKESLEEKWKFILAQDMLQNRLERCSRLLEEGWIHPHTRFLFPVLGYALASEEVSENLLSYLLCQAANIEKEGFLEEEFQVAQHSLLFRLSYFTSCANHPNNSFLADYYVDQFLFGNDPSGPEGFFTTSFEILSKLSLDDILVQSLLYPENRSIHLIYPTQLECAPLTSEGIKTICEEISSLTDFYEESLVDPFDSFFDIYPCESTYNQLEDSQFRFADPSLNISSPSIEFASFTHSGDISGETQSFDYFYQLPLNEKEKRLIKTIITTMAEKNIFQLAFEKGSLEKKGKKINQVHPLRFIGYIFSTPELKSALKIIKKSSFKWDAFLDGFSKRMSLEYQHNNLVQYVPGFSQLVGEQMEEVLHFIKKKDWEGLVLFLF